MPNIEVDRHIYCEHKGWRYERGWKYRTCLSCGTKNKWVNPNWIPTDEPVVPREH